MANTRKEYFKGDARVTVGCITEAVDGLLVSSAYWRARAWEKAPPNKDLDWLFRPIGYTQSYCNRIITDDSTATYTKGTDTVTVQCVMEVVRITRPAAIARCKKWSVSDWDLDWLFRPVNPNVNSKENPKRMKIKPKEKVPSSVQEEYVIALKKHMGLRSF